MGLNRYSYRVLITVVIIIICSFGIQLLVGAENQEYKIIDDLGREIRVDLPIKSIISTAPSNTEILFALGLGEKVFGVTEECNYPPEAKAKPKIGQVEMSIEKIIETSPDLVISVASMQMPIIEALSDLSIPVLAVDPKTVEDVLNNIILIGKATGTEEVAGLLAEDLGNQIRDIQIKAAKAVEEGGRPRVFVEIWDEPLMTAGPGTFIDELITIAGGENIAWDSAVEWPEFSTEVLIERNPEVIITVWADENDILTRPAWKYVSACKTGRIRKLDPDFLTRPGPRLIQGLSELLEAIHPDYFS